MMIKSLHFFILSLLTGLYLSLLGPHYYVVFFELLFIVTEALFLYAQIDFWFHQIYVSLVCFCPFPFASFSMFLLPLQIAHVCFCKIFAGDT